MTKLFGHPVPRSVQMLFFVEAFVLLLAVQLGAALRLAVGGLNPWAMIFDIAPALVFVCVCMLFMLALGLYERECCRDLRQSAVRLFVALIASLMVIAAIFYFAPDLAVWRSISLYALAAGFVFILIVRRIFISFADLERFKRPVLVIGTGPRAKQIEDITHKEKGHSYRVVGFVRMSEKDAKVDNYVDLKEWPNLLSIAQQYDAQEVVLAMRERRGGLPIEELLRCRLSGISVTDLPSFLERETGKLDLDVTQPSWLVFSQGFEMSRGINRVLKRLFDIFASLVLIAFSIWVLVPTAILIKLTSPGPVFYRQERVGRNGDVYRLFKFRSMRNDAERDGKPQWAQESDPRVTTVGKFIRATRIDEIPQILNVLSGEMSFVGPRPERPFFVDQLREEMPYYDERHIVKPGITGWAQINYPYGASVEDARKKLEYDLYYVKNFTVMLDLAILLQTVKVVVWQNGVR